MSAGASIPPADTRPLTWIMFPFITIPAVADVLPSGLEISTADPIDAGFNPIGSLMSTLEPGKSL